LHLKRRYRVSSDLSVNEPADFPSKIGKRFSQFVALRHSDVPPLNLEEPLFANGVVFLPCLRLSFSRKSIAQPYLVARPFKHAQLL